jgi:uncharacterized protein YndB with AHSA1/START domain
MRTIHHVLDVAASRQAVWSAITDADGLAGWWSTKLHTTKPVVGERITFTFAGDFNPVMEIVTLEDGRKVEWRCVGGHEPWDNGLFRFELVELDDGRTRLRFWQDYAVELSDDAYGVYNFNWGYYLESLRLLCTTGEGKPFQPE